MKKKHCSFAKTFGEKDSALVEDSFDEDLLFHKKYKFVSLSRIENTHTNTRSYYSFAPHF